MSRLTLNRLSLASSFALSAFAVGLVLATLALAPAGLSARDEGWQAHLFQLAMVAQLPLLIAVAASANWQRPRNALARLIAPVAAIGSALGILAVSGL